MFGRCCHGCVLCSFLLFLAGGMRPTAPRTAYSTRPTSPRTAYQPSTSEALENVAMFGLCSAVRQQASAGPSLPADSRKARSQGASPSRRLREWLLDGDGALPGKEEFRLVQLRVPRLRQQMALGACVQGFVPGVQEMRRQLSRGSALHVVQFFDREREETTDRNEDDEPHLQHLCGKCNELGHKCTIARRDDEEDK